MATMPLQRSISFSWPEPAAILQRALENLFAATVVAVVAPAASMTWKRLLSTGFAFRGHLGGALTLGGIYIMATCMEDAEKTKDKRKMQITPTSGNWDTTDEAGPESPYSLIRWLVAGLGMFSYGAHILVNW